MKIKNIFGGMICLALLASCGDEMDYHEYTNYDKDYVFTNFDNTVGFVTNIYGKLEDGFGPYGKGMLASACDEAEYSWKNGSVQDFTNGAWSALNAKDSWSNNYSAIRAANYYLAHKDECDFSDYKFNKDYAAQMARFERLQYEARYLRAYFYFTAVEKFGDVPFTTEVLSEDEANALPRTPAKEVMDFIVSECDAIADKLPVDYSTLGDDAAANETGRVNKLTVLALKARTLLYEASPLFNTTGDKELYHKAAVASKVVIDECEKAGLKLGKYSDLWGSNNWQAKEVIFARRVGSQNGFEYNNYPRGLENGNGGNCPTQTLVDAYEIQKTGKLWDEEGSGYNAANPYAGRDPRFAMTIAVNGEKKWPSYNGDALETYYGGKNGEPIVGATPTGYYLKKYCDGSVNISSVNSTNSPHAWIMFRLGEFYLNYAEATFKYLGSADATTVELPMSARQAVNVIRNRQDVKMPELAEGLNNDEFWKKYENERMVELAFEGHRFYDVRRWKEGSKLATITEMKITKNEDGTFTYTRNVVHRGWDDKMYFFPISKSELLKHTNPDFKQNPGW